MSSGLQVTMVTPTGEIFRGPQSRVVAPSESGEVTILPMHDLMLAYLAPGVVELGEGSGAQRLFVSGGFLEVQDDRVTLLVDSAEPTEAINSATAASQLRDAEAALATIPYATAGHLQAERAAECARRRLDAAQ